MKLYITVNRPIPSGYIGIDLSKQKVNFDDMDDICERAECHEIILDEILSYVSIDKMGMLLKQIISRLRKNGKIIIKDVDLNEITKLYINGRLNVNDINYLLFNQGKINKRGSYSVTDIRQATEQLGLETISVAIQEGYYTLITQRK